MTTQTTTWNDIYTARFPETVGGLMICGLEAGAGGGAVTPANASRPEKTFFSDARTTSFPYDRTLCKWLGLLGVTLATGAAEIGPLERSISQTNWWPSSGRNTDRVDRVARCLEHRERFVSLLDLVRPRLVLLLSCDMLEALAHDSILPRVQEILGGTIAGPHYSQKDVPNRVRFRVGSMRLDGADFVALPHPTGRNRPADDYISAFREDLAPIFARYLVALESAP
jgi:hypothetical protein